MKKLLAVFMTVAMSITTSIPALAAPMSNADAVKALHTADARFCKSADGAEITVDVNNTDWSVTITQILNKAFPACSQLEMGSMHYTYEEGSPLYTFEISNEQLTTLAEHQDAVNNWADSSARALFPSGTDRNTVLQTAYLHIVRNYSYESTISAENLRQAQGAYYMITTGKGICASYTKTFRALVEAVPFNPVTGVVDWECVEPTHIKVAIVYNAEHEWNAIQDLDGTWYHYELSTNTRKDAESMQFFHMPVSKLTNGKYASFYDYNHVVWCY